jgi:hypothetical protein
MTRSWILACLLISLSTYGCTFTSRAPDFNGLKAADGSTPIHVNTTTFALHLFLTIPMLGDASLESGVRDFTQAARNEGASRVRIVQSNETTLWWVLPPLSLLFTPRLVNVAGDALTDVRTR